MILRCTEANNNNNKIYSQHTLTQSRASLRFEFQFLKYTFDHQPKLLFNSFSTIKHDYWAELFFSLNQQALTVLKRNFCGQIRQTEVALEHN